jgi:hypothetical protein
MEGPEAKGSQKKHTADRPTTPEYKGGEGGEDHVTSRFSDVWNRNTHNLWRSDAVTSIYEV